MTHRTKDEDAKVAPSWLRWLLIFLAFASFVGSYAAFILADISYSKRSIYCKFADSPISGTWQCHYPEHFLDLFYICLVAGFVFLTWGAALIYERIAAPISLVSPRKKFIYFEFLLKFTSVAFLVVGSILILIHHYQIHFTGPPGYQYSVVLTNTSFLLMIASFLCSIGAAVKARQAVWLLVALIAFSQIAYSLLTAIR